MTTHETIDLVRLKHLPAYKLPSTYRLQKESGNGCFMDPPGYPTYFTRSVYTQHGNNPGRGPQQVIDYQNTLYVTQSHDDWKNCADHDAFMAKINRRLRLLYKPLPLDHLRVQAWIQAEFAYFRNCYVDMRKPEAIRKNVAELAILPDGAPLDFHRATIDIQEIYPEFVPTPEIAAGVDRGGSWWETEPARPAPETCKPRTMGAHPLNGTWCQWCGWRTDNEAAAIARLAALTLDQCRALCRAHGIALDEPADLEAVRAGLANAIADGEFDPAEVPA